MNVDPVHERAGDLGSIPLDLRNGAIALFGGIAVVTARATMRFQTTKNPIHW